MKFYESPELKWYAFAVLVVAFLLKFYLEPVNYIGLALIGASLACFTLIMIWSLTSLPEPAVFWDAQRGISAISRFWTIEVYSARLLTSVPIGIDLSHSGKKVLQSMYTRFINEPGGEIVFFINRPLENQSTKIGFLVRRRSLRLWSVFKNIEKLSKKITTDCAILERAMRAAYPHLPVEPASFQDIVKTTTGGLETHAIV